MKLSDDEQVIAAVLKGDKQAYAEIVRRYQNKLYGLFCKMGASPADAEDLTQETLLKAYRKLATHQPAKSFAGWLYTIAIHLQMDQGSRRSVSQPQPEPAGTDETPEAKWLRKELRDELDHLLASLPEQYRLVLVLRYTNQLSHQEIADLTGLSVRQVTNAVFRAKGSLRKRVKAKAKEGVRYDIQGACYGEEGQS